MQDPENGPPRWESLAVGLIAIATVLAGATAVGGLEVASEFGIGGKHDFNHFTRHFLKSLFILAALSYVVAWGFATSVIFGKPRWKKTTTLGLAFCVFLQSMSITVVALSITIAAFR